MFESNFIIHARAKQYHWAGLGALSIKTFHGGKAVYDVGCGKHLVDENSYLVLNQGQSYSLTIDSRIETESFCVFFRKDLAEEIYRSFTESTNRLLEKPDESANQELHFVEKNYSRGDDLFNHLLYLRTIFARKKPERVWMEEQYHILLERLLFVHRDIRVEMLEFPALRAATREELYRRLHRARDYAHAAFAEDVGLEEMARVACLSPNHFLRTFKHAFHQTPHQFLTRLRLESAREMLLQRKLSVTEICFAVGFESLGSFSSLFRKHFGISPAQYRSNPP